MQCLVEITVGWDGDTVKSTVFHDMSEDVLKHRAFEWVAKNKKCPREDTLAPYWTVTNVPCEDGEKYIFDCGSWVYFGRCTITDQRKQTQEKP